MANVNINSVSKSYGNHPVLFDIDVQIKDGEFVVLLGPSGCGKSTLLRMLAGLETITGGTIEIGDIVVNNIPPKDRDIAMVFQSYALYPHMTVAENMGFSLRVAGHRKADIAKRVAQAAEILNLTDYLTRFPRNLSGGQRQRVAMGRAIVRDPEVFLFDEPLSNLDAKLRVQMRAEIKDLHSRLGTTIVYVTHDQIEAMTMADRVVILKDGEVQQIGSPLDIYDLPVNAFVAGFIGSPAMNLISGKVSHNGSTTVLLTQDTMDLPLPDAIGKEQDGRDVLLGIRPENIRLVAKDDPNSISAEVILIEPTGAQTAVTLRIAGQDIIAIFAERIDAQTSTVLHVSFNPQHLHLFDKETGIKLQQL